MQINLKSERLDIYTEQQCFILDSQYLNDCIKLQTITFFVYSQKCKI